MYKGLYAFYITGTFLVLGISTAAYFVFCRYNMRRISYWVMAVLGVSSIYMLGAQYLAYRSLHFYVDFSSWTHLLHNIAATGKTWSFNESLIHSAGINYFSSHFVPLVYILALPFKIWPHSETLIIMNFLLMASSIIPLYKLALIKDGDRQFASFMAVLFLWYPTFQYIVLYEFDMLRLSIPIILWMLYFWERKKMNLYFIFALLAVLVREEVGLTIMMFGLYLLLFTKRRKVGFFTSLIGLAGFIVIVQIIMPAFRDTKDYGHIAVNWFSAFGATPMEIIKNVIFHPGLTLSTVFQPAKLANVFMFFLPLLFIPLLAPAILVSILANFGVGMLSKSITSVSYMLYYLSPSIPFIFYAFIKAWPAFLKRLKDVTSRQHLDVDIKSAAVMCVFSGILVSNIFFGPSPISLQFWFKGLRPAPFKTRDLHYSAYKITEHHRKAEEFCELIPDSAVVSAHHFLFSRLFRKRGTMVFPYFEVAGIKADYVFFDKTNNGLKTECPAYKTQRDFDLAEKDKKTWSLVKSEDGYFLFKRKR